jgi:hypothetical protein
MDYDKLLYDYGLYYLYTRNMDTCMGYKVYYTMGNHLLSALRTSTCTGGAAAGI